MSSRDGGEKTRRSLRSDVVSGAVVGGTLYSDAMGPEGSYEGTWLGMIDANVTTIARALGGQAPEAGRLGQLERAA